MTIMDDIIYRGKVRPMNAADGTAQWIVLTEENNVIACWKETLICDDEAGYSPELLWWKRKWQRNDALEKAVLEADALRHDHYEKEQAHGMESKSKSSRLPEDRPEMGV